jgi:hypothetical protein
MMNARDVFAIAVLALVSGISLAASLGPVQVYKDPMCGCCGKYIDYLRQEGVKVEVVSVADMSQIKVKYGVPPQLQSCHTSVANGYVIEGHVPVAAMRKLVNEGRSIKGIALPGMPAGSPGMGPVKPGTLTIYEIPDAGQTPKVFSVE